MNEPSCRYHTKVTLSISFNKRAIIVLRKKKKTAAPFETAAGRQAREPQGRCISWCKEKQENWLLLDICQTVFIWTGSRYPN